MSKSFIFVRESIPALPRQLPQTIYYCFYCQAEGQVPTWSWLERSPGCPDKCSQSQAFLRSRHNKKSNQDILGQLDPEKIKALNNVCPGSSPSLAQLIYNEQLCIVECAEKLDIPRSTLYDRLRSLRSTDSTLERQIQKNIAESQQHRLDMAREARKNQRTA